MEEETTSFNKEIQNLLDNVENSGIGGGKSWRKYARLVLPHVGLVIFVCFYALLGAWVFYSIESPHEDRLKVQGVRRVQELRRQLVKDILGGKNAVAELGRPTWMGATEKQLRKFGEDLFRAYKEQYVRFENVRPTASNATNATASPNATSQAQPVVVAQLDPRFRRHFSKSRSEGKMWTPSSALFFAATTMATIGYGNIVPMTSQGRIACIIFALFGAPLAIITIGDLGKFLSECTIWMYRRLKDKSRLYHFQFRQFWISRRKRRRRRLKENFVADELAMDGDLEMGAEEEGSAEGKLKAKNGNSAKQKEREKRRVEEAERDRRMTEWEEEEKLETEVPVLVVFAILLFYIAFGGVLFAFLESWTYMDAFYYCFVSLTTIGFGDLVPDRHEYIVLMLLYLGIGLAVTTMCIDLVGVQYIQKIHYFGRKFKGTDIMQILKRKRMMERRFAMGEGKEFIEFVIKKQEMEMEIQNKAVLQPGVIHLASQLHAQEPQDEEKISLRSCEPEWPMEESVVQDVIPTNELALAQSLSIPEILEPTPIARRLSSPTVSPSSESERSTMYNRLLSGRIDSWTESGPSISLNSPLSTEPSVQQREEFYANYKSPEPSPTSFAFSFPPPSPDLWKIADAARSSRRLASCPALPPYPEPVSHQNPRLWRKWRTLACPSRAFHELLRFSKRCVVVVLPFQSLSRRFSRAQHWEPDEEGNGHWPRLGTNGLGIGENGGEEAAAESIHHLDVLKRRVSFENQAEILQAPKAPPLRFISQPVWYYRRRRSLHQQQEGPTALPPAPPHSSAEQSNPATVPPIIHQKATIPLEAYQPILKRKRRERLARRFDPLLRFDWLALSPRIAVTEEGGRPATMEEISERAQELLKMEDLPKQLASEHPIYQHLANLESGTADLGSTSAFDQSQSGGTSSARLITGQAQRFSLESLALSLKAARRWKEQTRKRDSISSQGQGPSTSKNLLPQMKWLMKSQRRTSLGGGQISGFISKELTFGNGRKLKETIGTTALESPRRILGQSLEEEENSRRGKDKGEWRQMSMEVAGKKSPIRPRHRASVAEEIRIGAAGGSRGSRGSLGPPAALEEEESPKVGNKVGISGRQISPARQRASMAGRAETSSAGQRRQMSIIDIGAQKSPAPSRTRQRASVAGAAGGSRGSIVPGGNEFRLKVPTKSVELPTTSKELTLKGKPESKQQQQTKRPAGSKGEEANPSEGK